MRYSRLDQINRENVTRLRPAWTYHTRELEGRTGKTIECTPIVVDGVMYVTTGYLRVVALDAATGKELWQFDPLKDHPFPARAGLWRRQPRLCLLERRQARRPAAHHPRHGGRAVVFAEREKRQARPRVRRARCPQPAHGVRAEVRRAELWTNVRAGRSGTIRSSLAIPPAKGPASPRRGISERSTSARARRSGGSDTVPRSGEFGNETWKGDSWTDRGGANAWGGFSVDRNRGMVFAGLGSAAFDFYGGDRHGDNLFANCTIALDARSGKRRLALSDAAS